MSTESRNAALAMIVPTAFDPGVARATLANTAAPAPAIARDTMYFFIVFALAFECEPSHLMLISFHLQWDSL
jgi:hypothetical protein